MTPRVRVKVCGITRRIDADAAVEAGADAIGFVFWRGSPRAREIDTFRAIAFALPPLVARVGVFVNESPDVVMRTAADVPLDAVQLHGDEPVEPYRTTRARVLRSVTLESDADVDAALALPPFAMPLVDASDPARRGGTGQTADWTRAAGLARRRPIILAGGLTPENVGDAIRLVRPWGVDVSSGVETEPGIKSASRIRQFLAAVSAVRLEGV